MPDILKINKYPDKILREKARCVQEINDEIRTILSNMLFTMYASAGVGLAASQVGVDKQIIVADIGNGPVKLINPRIISRKGTNVIEEGCLSLPEVLLKVKRAQSVEIKALDENAERVILSANGFLARVLQHEIDHLNGILIIDYANFIKRKFLHRNLLQHKNTKVM